MPPGFAEPCGDPVRIGFRLIDGLQETRELSSLRMTASCPGPPSRVKLLVRGRVRRLMGCRLAGRAPDVNQEVFGSKPPPQCFHSLDRKIFRCGLHLSGSAWAATTRAKDGRDRAMVALDFLQVSPSLTTHSPKHHNIRVGEYDRTGIRGTEGNRAHRQYRPDPLPTWTRLSRHSRTRLCDRISQCDRGRRGWRV